jgi:hypothetical protein
MGTIKLLINEPMNPHVVYGRPPVGKGFVL